MESQLKECKLENCECFDTGVAWLCSNKIHLWTREEVVEYTKSKVKEALEAACNSRLAGVYSANLYERHEIDKKRILESYPLDKVK